MNSENVKDTQEEKDLDLRAKREEKGLSLKDIARETRINLPLLEAIEKKEFQSLPEPIYTRAFIKAYTTALDIDSDELLSLYADYLAEIDASVQKIAAAEKSKTSQSRYKYVVAAVVILFAVVAISIGMCTHKKSAETVEAPSAEISTPEPPQQETAKETTTQEAGSEGSHAPAVTKEQEIEEEGTTVSPDTGTPAAGEEETVAPLDTPYVLEIEATELSWVKITEDYNTPFEVLMRPGEKMTRKASEKFLVSIGNAGGVMVTFQGTSLGTLGEHGKVIHLNLPGDEKNPRRYD